MPTYKEYLDYAERLWYISHENKSWKQDQMNLFTLFFAYTNWVEQKEIKPLEIDNE